MTHKTASLDHLVPVLHGGTNKQSNLKTAHKRCNEKRGDRIHREPPKSDRETLVWHAP